jgi:acyl carrier protein
MNEKLFELASTIFGVEASTIGLQSSLLNTPTWTSLAHITLISTVEQEFDVRFEMNEIIGIKTMGDIALLLKEKAASTS